MDITLNGMTFDVDGLGLLKDQDLPAQLKSVREARNQQVYFWQCKPPGRARFFPPAKPPGKVPLRSMIVFALGPGGFRPKLDGKSSRAMMRSYLKKTSANTMSDAVSSLHTAVRIPVIDIPLSAFEWMNPFATYVINHETIYAMLDVSNAQASLRCTVLLPHRSVFTAEILDECQPDAMAEQEAAGKDPDEKVVVLHAGANKRVNFWRRAALRVEARSFGIAGLHHPEAKLINEELRKLTP